MTLACVAFLVRDYDEALAYFTQVLEFQLVEDTVVSESKRWVVVASGGAHSVALLLAKAATPEQQAHVGTQTGGRVAFFLHTDNFERDYAAMKSRGVKFIEPPRDEPYGRVVVFEDLYGNRWDLLEPSSKLVE
jgi:catechol 2,3-dioxygenase-like lactoylglutathione lyase family enzyme